MNRAPRVNLFHTSRAEIALKIKIIVQTVPINLPDGVHEGKEIVLYQPIPPAVSNPPKTATTITVSGINM